MRLFFSCKSALGWSLLSLIAPLLGAHSLPSVPSGAVSAPKFPVSTRAKPRPLSEILAHLPPAPAEVADLTFGEFFGPVGDRGLEYSPKLRALAGQRVRIAGFVVRQDLAVPGLLLLTAAPVSVHEIEYGFCDDLPPATLHVIVPAPAIREITWQPGPVVLTGRLELGPRAEADGRNSVARLILELPSPANESPASAVPAKS